jgi:hypothetical protein
VELRVESGGTTYDAIAVPLEEDMLVGWSQVEWLLPPVPEEDSGGTGPYPGMEVAVGARVLEAGAVGKMGWVSLAHLGRKSHGRCTIRSKCQIWNAKDNQRH